MTSRFVASKELVTSSINKTLGKYISNFSVTTDNGKEILYDGEELHEGLQINTYDANGDITPLGDGDYTINGVDVTVQNGVISKISKTDNVAADPKADPKAEPKAEPAAEPAAEPTEDPNKDPNKDLVEENKNLKLEIESLKAEIADLKKPAGKAVEQKTQLSSNADNKLDDRTKGTKFESAYRIFNS